MKNLLTSLGINAEVGEWNIGALSMETLLHAAVTLILCIIAARLVRMLLRRALDTPKVAPQVKKYALLSVRVLAWIVTVLIIADQLGIPVTSLVALLSVFSLAVSLAIQNFLGNVAGGLVILTTKPFQIGDYIDTTSGVGTVTQVGLNSTWLQTDDGQRLVIPNNQLSADRIINYTTLGSRRIKLTVSASYAAAPETVRSACLSAVAKLPQVLTSPAPEVLLTNYGASSIEYTVRVWCKPSDYASVYFPLLESFYTAFKEAGIEMTYDHLNVHLDK